MDRFKFRVWDKNNKKLLKSPYILLYSTTETVTVGIGKNELCLCYEDCIIQQCTGLKDKNGKLIYEGCIIINGDGRKWEVIWNNDNQAWGLKELNTNHKWSMAAIKIKEYEIIGNIHANKDLLKGDMKMKWTTKLLYKD